MILSAYRCCATVRGCWATRHLASAILCWLENTTVFPLVRLTISDKKYNWNTSEESVNKLPSFCHLFLARIFFALRSLCHLERFNITSYLPLFQWHLLPVLI